MFKLLFLFSLIALGACKSKGKGRWSGKPLPELNGANECLEEIEVRLSRYQTALNRVRQNELRNMKDRTIPNFLPPVMGVNVIEQLNSMIAQITSMNGGMTQISGILDGIIPGAGNGGAAAGNGTASGGTSGSRSLELEPRAKSIQTSSDAILGSMLKYMSDVYKSVDDANQKLIKILQDYSNSKKEK